jgi:hypothetical protein
MAVRLLLLAVQATKQLMWAVAVALTEVAVTLAAAAAVMAVQMQLRLALGVVPRFSPPLVVAAGVAQVASIRLISAERVELPAVPLRAQAAARFQRLLIPARRLLRGLQFLILQAAAVQAVPAITPVQVQLVALVRFLAVEEAVAEVVHP